MITLRKSEDRGHGGHGISWLDSKHTFSFADYYDANHMGFASLRVINEDRVAPNGGFATHPHKDMEIVSYVISGQLEHKDSMGNGSVIKAGDVQRMSAGTGVTHSEFNPSTEEPVHFLQIWFLPEKNGIQPSYQQQFFSEEAKQGQFKLVMSQQGGEGVMSINQDMNMYVALLDQEAPVHLEVEQNRAQWVQMVKGQVQLNGELLNTGDAAAITETKQLNFSHAQNAEIIVFDMRTQ